MADQELRGKMAGNLVLLKYRWLVCEEAKIPCLASCKTLQFDTQTIIPPLLVDKPNCNSLFPLLSFSGFICPLPIERAHTSSWTSQHFRAVGYELQILHKYC